ncbi:MAG: SRPBCC domain-containing protein [Saprospiraceae bacterium]|nr:SRPBCC domain-containing protein [Saprospiraceae bacterium]
MADIFHNFPVNAPLDRVFGLVSTPEGLDKWWAKASSGKTAPGEIFKLHFEPAYHWTAIVSKYLPFEEFELTMQISDPEWEGSKVGFRLFSNNNLTEVQFYHTGWKELNEHYKISNYCWAMYLRILKRNLEFDEFVPYMDRLFV